MAVYLEQLAGDDGERYVDLLAYHYDHSDNLPKRRDYLRRAGLAAKKRYANEVALDYLSRALDLTPEADMVERYALVNRRYWVHNVQAARAAMEQDLETSEQLAEALNDDWCRLDALVLRVFYALCTYDHRGVVSAVQHALVLAQALGEFLAAASVTSDLVQSLLYQGQVAAARAQVEVALEWVRDARTAPSVEVSAIRTLIEALWGDTVERRITNTEAHILRMLNQVQEAQGDYAAAHASLVHSLRLYDEIGEQSQQTSVFNGIGEVLRKQGAYAEAQRAYEQCVQLARAMGDNIMEGYSLANTALVAHQQGNHTLARTLSEQALAIGQTVSDRVLEPFARTNLGHALMGLGQPVVARASYQMALELFCSLDQPMFATESQMGLADVALAEGDPILALAHVEAILAYLADGGSLGGTNEPLRISLTCYQVLHAMDDPRAAGVLATAHATLLEQAAKIFDPAMQRSFLENVPYHRAIVTAWEAQQAHIE